MLNVKTSGTRRVLGCQTARKVEKEVSDAHGKEGIDYIVAAGTHRSRRAARSTEAVLPPEAECSLDKERDRLARSDRTVHRCWVRRIVRRGRSLNAVVLSLHPQRRSTFPIQGARVE